MPEWTREITPRLARLALRPAREREIVEELSQHLDDRYEELRAQGNAHAAAIQLALSELDDDISGGNLLAREMLTLRQATTPAPPPPGAPSQRLMADTWRDLVYAARMLRKSPGFAAAAILTLALGIGANTAIFSLVNATLLQRLPVAQSDRVDYVFNGGTWNTLSYPAYAVLRDGTRAFDALAAWGGITASLNADGDTDLVSGVIVTGNFFDALGVRAVEGRVLGRDDDLTPGAHPVAVISHRLWQSRFAGRTDIVGTTIHLNGGQFTIVGVTPANFPGPQLGIPRDLYVPMMMQALMRPPRAGYSGEQNPDLLKNPNNSWLFQVGRRKAGVSRDQALADVVAVTTNYLRARGDPNARHPRLTLEPIDRRRSGAAPSDAIDRAALDGFRGHRAAHRVRERRQHAARPGHRATPRSGNQAGGGCQSLAHHPPGAHRERTAVIDRRNSGRLSRVAHSEGFRGGTAARRRTADRARFHRRSPGAAVLAGPVTPHRHRLRRGAGDPDVAPGLLPGLKDETAPEPRARRVTLKKALVIAEVALSLLLLIAAALFIRSLQDRAVGRSRLRGGRDRLSAPERQHSALYDGPGTRILPASGRTHGAVAGREERQRRTHRGADWRSASDHDCRRGAAGHRRADAR
jgi:hypothetical protein